MRRSRGRSPPLDRCGLSETKILLVETDGPSAALISAALTVAGHELTTVGTSVEATSLAGSHALVIVDVLPGRDEPVALCAAIKAAPASARVPVLAIAGSDDLEERIGLIEAGADDVMTRPFDPSELEVRVQALLVRSAGASGAGLVGDAASATRTGVRVLTVYSPKGGVGTTMTAVNLALAAAIAAPGRVLLVDLDVQWGQVATNLNLSTHHSIVDAVRDQACQTDASLLRSYSTRHDSGVHVLPAPPHAGSADLVPADVTAALVERALDEFDLVVIDAGSDLGALSLMALDVADAVVLPVVPDIPALKPVVQLFEYLNETGSVADKTNVVLNQLWSKALVTPDQIEGLLGLRITARLPYEEATHLRATNEGNPIVRSAPASPSAVAFLGLAQQLFGLELQAPSKKGGFLRR